ncbi:MAG: hypothetical protein V1774_01100 [Candidatus Eisenbacteria bacterium]
MKRRVEAALWIGILLAPLNPWVSSAAAAEAGGIWISHLYMNDLRDVAVTDEGVWCATGGGALFYDFALGRFRAWNRSSGGLASDTLTAVAVLPDGRVAFGTDRAGVCIHDPEQGGWQTYTSLTWPIAGDAILCIVDDPPWRIIGSRGGFVALNNEEVRETCQQGLDICGLAGWDIAAAAEYQGGLWFGALPAAQSRGGVARLDYATSEWDTLNTGLFASPPEIIGFAVWQDSLFCAYRNGVALWNGLQWVDAGAGLPVNKEIRDITAGPQHLLLAVAGDGRGVFQWSPAEKAWTRLGTFFAQCVAEGADGIVWAGAGATRTGSNWLEPSMDGLWAYAAGEWIQHRQVSPHPLENYRDLTLDGEGRLWAALAASGRGWKISRFDEQGWRTFDHTNTDLSNTWVLDLRIQDGIVWAGHCCCAVETDSCYLNRWDEAAGTVAVHDSVFNIYASAEDPWGNLWFASWYEHSTPVAKGLYHLDVATGRMTQYTTENTAGRLRSNRITDLAVADQALWIGYYSEGASRCELSASGLPIMEDWAWESFATDHPDDPLPSDGVRAVAARAGEAWIGTIAGVSLLRDGQWRIFRPGPLGLPGSQVTDIALTADGAAWIALYGVGVTRITRDAAGVYAFDHFGPPDLVGPNPTVLTAGAGGRDLWVGTTHGLSHFIPSGTVDATAPAEIHVYPNPYNPACGEPLRIARIPGRAAQGMIVDVSGRVMARFSDRWTGDAIWDGRDLDGNRVAPGFYVIRAATPRGWLTGQVGVLDLPCSE